MRNKLIVLAILVSKFTLAQTTDQQKKNTFRKGYRGIIQAGFGKATGEKENDKLEIDLINGLQTNKYFSIGIGAGYRKNDYYSFMPVYLHVRGYFTDKPIAPFAALSLGYSFNTDNHFDPMGVLIHPQAGVSFIGNNTAFNLCLGFEIQNSEHYGYSYPSYSTYNDADFAVTITAGFSF